MRFNCGDERSKEAIQKNKFLQTTPGLNIFEVKKSKQEVTPKVRTKNTARETNVIT